MNRGTFELCSNHFTEFIDITDPLEKIVRNTPVQSGLLYVFTPHTTAGLTINEGADPAVQGDLVKALQRIAPMDINYQHQEGNSRSHLLTLLTGNSVTIEVENSRLVLGIWQRVFFCEYDGPRTRKVNWRIISSSLS